MKCTVEHSKHLLGDDRQLFVFFTHADLEQDKPRSHTIARLLPVEQNPTSEKNHSDTSDESDELTDDYKQVCFLLSRLTLTKST